MAVYQEKDKKKWTKDGRSWYFRDYYINLKGERKQYESPKYMTKPIAKDKEREWLNKLDSKVDNKNLKFKDLYQLYYSHQKTRVKETTFQTYLDRVQYLELLDNVKLTDFKREHYELWRNEIDAKSIATSYKNDIQKFLKAILNFGSVNYNYNFTQVYNVITPFKNDLELPKEMDFYTIDEFNLFINNVSDLKYKCLFKALFYLGLRNGEMRGLRWNRIDWINKKIYIRTQIPTRYTSKNYKETTLKSKSSIRTLPIADTLFEDLKEYYNQVKEYKNFNDDWFIFGDVFPIVADNPHEYQTKICNKIDLRVIRIHDFRHSCASYLINRGADITTVAKFLGHSKIDETLNTYAHMYKDRLDEIVNISNSANNSNGNEVPELLNQLLIKALESGELKDLLLKINEK